MFSHFYHNIIKKQNIVLFTQLMSYVSSQKLNNDSVYQGILVFYSDSTRKYQIFLEQADIPIS